MDKHINFINGLKKRLNKLLIQGSYNYQNYKELLCQFTDISLLRALLIKEGVQSAYAMQDLNRSEIYAELKNGNLNFHIYPLVPEEIPPRKTIASKTPNKLYKVENIQ